jgi:UDP-glucose 4-epimerase
MSGPAVVLVTGAAGQIGRALGRLLDEKGIARRGVDVVEAPGDAPFLRCDLSDPAGIAALREFCRPVTHAVHLASRITNEKDLAACYARQYALNVGGTLNLLEALPAGLRHVAFASTMTVYGAPRSLPVRESHPVAPNCVYALCKLAAERFLAEFAGGRGIPAAVLRYSSAYGPGPFVPRAIPRMIRRLLDGEPPEVFGDGSVRRDYIYVDDLCRATLQACRLEADGVFNVGTGIGTSSAELAAMLSRLAGARLQPRRVGGALDAQAASSLWFDIAKMRRELGCSPEVSLEDGLAATIRHFQKEGGRTDERAIEASGARG